MRPRGLCQRPQGSRAPAGERPVLPLASTPLHTRAPLGSPAYPGVTPGRPPARVSAAASSPTEESRGSPGWQTGRFLPSWCCVGPASTLSREGLGVRKTKQKTTVPVPAPLCVTGSCSQPASLCLSLTHTHLLSLSHTHARTHTHAHTPYTQGCAHQAG